MRPQHVAIEVDPLQKTLSSLQVELQKAQRRGLSETTQGRPATLRDQDLDPACQHCFPFPVCACAMQTLQCSSGICAHQQSVEDRCAIDEHNCILIQLMLWIQASINIEFRSRLQMILDRLGSSR